MDDPHRWSRGAFVVVVGPDGVGKSSLAGALLEQAPVTSGYFHFRPPLSGPLPRHLPVEESPAPKQTGASWPPLGWLRLGLALVRFWLGYIRVVLPILREGGLVVGDRWAYGYLVQPAALRYRGPPWLARVAIGWLPSPDLVVNLAAPAAEIRRRKKDLTEHEIATELNAWGRLPVRKLLTLDALQTPQEMAARVLSELAR